jgi:hypothetical protein
MKVIHEGLGDVKGERAGPLTFVWPFGGRIGEDAQIAVVSGRSPGLGARSPGKRARVKRLGLWAGVIGAGGERLTRRRQPQGLGLIVVDYLSSSPPNTTDG